MFGGRDIECSERRDYQCDSCRIKNLRDALENLTIQLEHGLEVEEEIHEGAETELPSWLSEAKQIVSEIRTRELI